MVTPSNRRLILALSLIALLLSAGAATSERPQYKEGDDAFKGRKKEEQAIKAVTLFRTYVTQNPTDPEAAWRLSMGCYFGGLHVAKEDEEKKKYFAEGREAGLQAIDLAPNCAPCHFWTAINMALYGQTVGALKMLFTLGSIQEHLKQSIRLEPQYMGAGATRLLGIIEQKLPGILGGSNDRAKSHFEKAIVLAPDEPLNYLFLVKLLDSKFNDITYAQKVALKGLLIPPPGDDRLESQGSLIELREFLVTHPVAVAPSPSPSVEPKVSPSPQENPPVSATPSPDMPRLGGSPKSSSSQSPHGTPK